MPGFLKCSYCCLPLYCSMVDLWSVWMSSLTVQCYDRLLGSIKAHSQTETSNHIFTLHLALKSLHRLIWISPCLGMSLNCQAEPARNSRLDVLYTYTFTSVDIMSWSNFTSGKVALDKPEFVPLMYYHFIIFEPWNYLFSKI